MSESNKPQNPAKDPSMKHNYGKESCKPAEGKSDNTEQPQKTKKQLKEERRALQVKKKIQSRSQR